MRGSCIYLSLLTCYKVIVLQHKCLYPEGCTTSTKLLLERIHPNIVEHQVSTAGSNFDYYEIKPDKLLRRSDLLESNLNH